MYIVAIAWIFVVVLMSAAEATSTQGSLLGAFFTLLLYGVLPLSIVLYVMGTPARRRARLATERVALAQQQSAQASQPATAGKDAESAGSSADAGLAGKHVGETAASQLESEAPSASTNRS